MKNAIVRILTFVDFTQFTVQSFMIIAESGQIEQMTRQKIQEQQSINSDLQYLFLDWPSTEQEAHPN